MATRKYLPKLVLSAKRSVWRMHDHADEADRAFRQVRRAVLEAADNTCEYCDQRSEKYQEVHHADDDHKNNSPINLIATCPLCHQVFHIGLAGMKEGGDLIYLPEMSQAELNQLALVIWLVTETDPASIKDASDALLFNRLFGRAKTLQGMLENRRGTVQLRLKTALKETEFPAELIDKIKLSHLSPTLLSNVLMSLPDEQYDIRDKLLGGIRMLPKPARFRERINHWITEQEAVLPIPTWYKLVPDSAIHSIIVRCTDDIAKLTASTAAE